MLQDRIKKVIMTMAFHTPLKDFVLYKHRFNFTVPQLIFLCNCLERNRNVKGAIAEVGCLLGSTTIFLNKYMDSQNIEKKYYAIDTFSGFVAEDIEYEVSERGKRKIWEGFQFNDKKWFDYTMQLNDVYRVKSIKVDVNKFDLTKLSPLSFAVLDIDLYRPTRKCLPELYRALTLGGIIVVDDCDSTNEMWNGSDQAYKEFMEEIKQPIEIVYNKLGVVRK